MLFGLDSLFTSKKHAVSAFISVLNTYRSAAFPAGVPQSAVLASSTKKQCNLALPFAAKGEHAAILAHLHTHLSPEISLHCEVKLTEAACFKQIKHIVLVASGKGGVGKSTCAVNLAYALMQEGAKVGVLDADIYGPSIPLLLGLQGQQPVAKDDTTLLPMQSQGLKAQSIGFLVSEDDATVWRGPMASQALSQLLNETQWDELDYLLVDMPPGTGDIQLTMSQKVPASGAVIVTTPQDLALADAHKGVAMFNKVNVPILGLLENMSHFECPHCQQTSPIFGQDGAAQLASRYGVPILAHLPLDMAVREASEQGKSIVHQQQAHAALYQQAARQLASALYYQQSNSELAITITDD